MKVILMTVLFTVLAVACFGVFQFGVGMDVVGKHGLEWEGNTGQIDKEYDVNIGVAPAMEYMKQYKSFLYGLGAEYQVQRTVKFSPEGKDGKMGFIPIYGVLRYQIYSPFMFYPEIAAHAGYNFMTADDDYLEYDAEVKGGLYWGLGAGVVIHQDYLVQLMYKTNYGRYEAVYNNVDYKAKIVNTELNFSVNYRF